ncbi:MAG: septum formation protein Maf [Halobacteriovoraceae bacterium]|jgi:septum formation protein|nr:septum formation protein Maf [Halobacteriovoraceae bacterium]MBT5094757.1 septum formation protein Maf [Halobacteriovoraceae bacterium]
MDSNEIYKLILGSQSPRRLELLKWLEIPFEVRPSYCKEESEFELPLDFAKDIATQKGRSVMSDLKGKVENPLVIAADTVVSISTKILGKPKNSKEAAEMLLLLSGKKHMVTTAVYLASLKKEKVFAIESEVTFSAISEDILERYLKTEDSLDKAGSYGIQGMGLTFIDKVEGSYSNVVGFPLSHFITELKDFLGYVNDEQGQYRKLFGI